MIVLHSVVQHEYLVDIDMKIMWRSKRVRMSCKRHRRRGGMRVEEQWARSHRFCLSRDVTSSDRSKKESSMGQWRRSNDEGEEEKQTCSSFQYRSNQRETIQSSISTWARRETTMINHSTCFVRRTKHQGMFIERQWQFNIIKSFPRLSSDLPFSSFSVSLSIDEWCRSNMNRMWPSASDPHWSSTGRDRSIDTFSRVLQLVSEEVRMSIEKVTCCVDLVFEREKR